MGAAAEIEALIDEYAAAEAGDPRRAKAGRGARSSTSPQAHGFDRDLGLDLKGDRDGALAKLDEHICDLKELQIRDGLHVLGEGPAGRQRAETLVALARVPRGGGRGGRRLAAARARRRSWARLRSAGLRISRSRGRGHGRRRWRSPSPLAGEGQGGGKETATTLAWRTYGDTVERLEALALDLVGEPASARRAGALCMLPPSLTLPRKGGGKRLLARAPRPSSSRLRDDIAPALDSSGAREIAAVLAALAGKFVPPGPSGAPTRGRADCLPTGRNFYSVDVRAVPTPAAWELGRRSADLLAERYFQDEGEWPKAIALTVWGTSNMRTGGDDIAQALALIGARPVWEGASGRVTGIEVDPALRAEAAARRRDAAHLRLLPRRLSDADRAVPRGGAGGRRARRAGGRQSDRRAHPRRREAARRRRACREREARKAASFRIFGSKPGAYGAGLQALIDEGIWAERKDLAAAFLEWSAYAYGGGAEGKGARDLLETRLKATDAVVQNQDNREHDLLDSDDYYQFEGGLAASVETLRGAAPRVFHNDHSRPERPVIRALDEEIARVVRGRAANPKWIAGVMRHGYKGAFEIAATVDYLFAFAATTNAVKHHHFEQLYDAYLGDAAVRGFIAENNAAGAEGDRGALLARRSIAASGRRAGTAPMTSCARWRGRHESHVRRRRSHSLADRPASAVSNQISTS